MKKYLLLITFMACLGGCKKESNSMSPIPKITFQSVDPQTVKAGSSEDMVIRFKFEDGDADLSYQQPSNIFDVFFTESRSGDSFRYQLPAIPEQMQDPSKGIEGYADVRISAGFFPLDSSQQADTFHFDFYIKDRSGNLSNTATTGNIYLVK